MAKQNIHTSLLGRKVTVSGETATMAPTMLLRNYAGQTGEIVSVYMEKDDLRLGILMADGHVVGAYGAWLEYWLTVVG